MKIYFCREGLTRIMDWLQEEIPEDQVLACSEEDVPQAAQEADVLIPTVSKITEEALRSPSVKLVHQFGAGLDTVDIPAATRHGVYVANVPSAGSGNAESVAEIAILHMLALARQYPRTQESLHARRLGTPMGMALKGRTVGIVGFGGIGQEVAQRLKGFDMKILAVSKRGPKPAVSSVEREGEEKIDFHGPAESLPEVLRESDFVVVALPLNEETHGFIGQKEFSQMKAGAFVINVARGPVIDHDALVEALKEGKITGAGLDVFWEEPADPSDPVFAYNVMATPHLGGATDLSLKGIAKRVAENLNRLRRGEIPLNCVNPQARETGNL